MISEKPTFGHKVYVMHHVIDQINVALLWKPY